MTVLWLIIWACNSFPAVHVGNSWFVGLGVMAAIDVGGGIDRISARHAKARRAPRGRD